MEKLAQVSGTLFVDGTKYAYKCRTMSVRHLPELREDIDRLRRTGQISDAKTFQAYLGVMDFSLPENFTDAQSILVIAVAIPPLVAHLQFNGTRYLVYMPPNYYEPGFPRNMLLDEIQQNIIRERGHRVEGMGNKFHLKLLSARSGLGRYGRNNISYVDGMGSFLILRSYLTDYHFEGDNWGEVQMLKECENCSVCRKQCPTGAIRDEDFVIDVKRCIPLYNEIEGILPDWIPAEAHNSFFGCMKCQALCPANREAMKQVVQVEDITEEEIRQFIEGNPEEGVIQSVSRKLKIPHLVDEPETVQVVSRNIKAALHIS